MIPDDRKYAKTHEWIKIDGELAVIGISDYAQNSLGDITFIDFPDTGAETTKAVECAVIESVKAASDLYSPVSGTVAEINEEIETAPEKINTSPYKDGWIFKLKDFNMDEYNSLMNSSEYEKFLESTE